MQADVTLIVQSQIDWTQFIHATNRILNRSPTRELDANNIAVGPPVSFLSALGEIELSGQDPIAILRTNENVLNFLTYTFLVSCDHDTLFQVLQNGHEFKFCYGQAGKHRENFVMTGTLRAWRDLIINCCKKDQEPDIRMFCALIWGILDKLGFREIFATYQRKALHDNTFILESR